MVVWAAVRSSVRARAVAASQPGVGRECRNVGENPEKNLAPHILSLTQHLPLLWSSHTSSSPIQQSKGGKRCEFPLGSRSDQIRGENKFARLKFVRKKFVGEKIGKS